MAKLKVFCTPIGFHDAYVAAPSRKAALAAWGAERDLFARGVAQVVTDEALSVEPLAKPGEVIRRLRATPDEQLAHRSPTPPKRRRQPAPDASEPKPARARKPAPAREPPKPRPSRALLDAAEQSRSEADTRHAEEREALAAEESALARRKRDLARAQERESAKLDAAVKKAKTAYDEAVAAWRG